MPEAANKLIVRIGEYFFVIISSLYLLGGATKVIGYTEFAGAISVVIGATISVAGLIGLAWVFYWRTG